MTALVEKHFQKGDATSAALYSPAATTAMP